MPSKSIFTSKTFWGAVIGLLAVFVPQLFPRLGLQPDSVTDNVVAAIGFALTLYGRWMATRPVTVLPPVPPAK